MSKWELEYREVKNQEKYPAIAEELLSRIKGHRYGRRMPPVRALAVEFSVSTRTMQKALTQLINSSWICPEGVRGNRINYQKDSRQRNGVVCIFVNSAVAAEDPLIVELLELIRNAGCQALLKNVPDFDSMSRYETVSSMPVDGFIFLFSSIRQKLCEVLSLADIPFVSANQLPEHFSGSWCDFDYRQAYREMLSQLSAAGIRRIALHDLPRFSGSQERIKVMWKELMEEFKIPRRYRFPVLGRRKSDLLEEDLNEHLDEWFSRRCIPQAVICRSGREEFFAEQLQKRFKLRVPEDVKIFKADNRTGGGGSHLGQIFFQTPYNELAHVTWELFQKKARGESDSSKLVTARFGGIKGL